MGTIQRSVGSPDRTVNYNLSELLFMSPEVARRSVDALRHHSPSEWYDFLNLSSAFFVLDQSDLALLAARQALYRSRNPATLLNLAVILESQSEFYSAFALAEEAYALDPSDNFVCILYSDALLRMGRFSEGWQLYSRSHTSWAWLSSIIPEWNGEFSISGKRVLVLSGGGYGDTLFHLRWIPCLKSLGAQVTFMCPASMHSLLQGKYGFDKLIAGSVAGLEGTLIPADYDFYTCVLSLGGYFPSVSLKVPYLGGNLAPSGAVGLCACAGEEKVPRRNRSLTAQQVERLDSVPLPWVSLDLEGDWLHTADILSTLSLVVTVDTAIAHLAGAMGIKTFVILPGNSAFYYGIRGDRNPFYPSQRLFRNHDEGMDRAVDNVCLALQEEL